MNTKEEYRRRHSRVYPAQTGDKIRIAVLLAGKWRYLFWFKISREGSLYLGPSYKPTTKYSLNYMRNPGNTITLKSNAFEDITDQKVIKDSHISIHGSGQINMARRKYKRPSIRNLIEQEHICSILFEHPSKYPELSEKDPPIVDVCINYPIDEKRPLIGEIWLSPRGKTRFVTFRDPKPDGIQINIIFEITGFDDGIDRVVQFVLFHMNKGNWGEYTHIIIPSGRRRIYHIIRRIFLRGRMFVNKIFSRINK